MSNKLYFRFMRWPLAMVAMLALVAAACSLGGPYHEEFNSIGTWGSQTDANVDGQVVDGRFEFQVNETNALYWSTGGETFGNATYELEATAIDGPLNNGFGMMFRINNDTDAFYLFEVSSDGFAWIGYCNNGCAENNLLVGDGWIESAAIKQGLNQTNALKVEVNGADMIFYVNGEEVGRATDSNLVTGDIGILVETFDEGGVKVAFDNFKVTLPEEAAE